jgi:hypothetical protein
MKFTITNPVDLTELELEAEPEDYNGDHLHLLMLLPRD